MLFVRRSLVSICFWFFPLPRTRYHYTPTCLFLGLSLSHTCIIYVVTPLLKISSSTRKEKTRPTMIFGFLVQITSPTYHPLPLLIPSTFFSTSPSVLSNSPAICICFVVGSLANSSHRSPSTTAFTGA